MRAAFFVAKMLILGAVAGASFPAIAGLRAAGKPSASAKSRDVIFDGSTVTGKYLSAGEATSTVEQEKNLGDLAGIRANFNDRLRAERAQLAK